MRFFISYHGNNLASWADTGDMTLREVKFLYDKVAAQVKLEQDEADKIKAAIERRNNRK